MSESLLVIAYCGHIVSVPVGPEGPDDEDIFQARWEVCNACDDQATQAEIEAHEEAEAEGEASMLAEGEFMAGKGVAGLDIPWGEGPGDEAFLQRLEAAWLE